MIIFEAFLLVFIFSAIADKVEKMRATSKSALNDTIIDVVCAVLYLAIIASAMSGIYLLAKDVIEAFL